jgi:hypothetical protein
MFHMLQMIRGILQAFIQNVSSVSKCLLQSFLSGCCICFTHILQWYVPNVSAILVLRCSKWFHIASCKSGCFVCFTHILQVYVLNVSSTFRRMLHSNVFYVASVLYCTARGERTGHAPHRGPTNSGAMARGALGVCLSSVAHPGS